WPCKVGVGTDVLRSHNAIRAAVSLACNHRDFGNGGLRERKKKFSAVANDAAVFLLRARQKSGNVFKRNQGNIERVAETNKPRALYRSIDVERSCEKSWLIRDDANGPSLHTSETNNDVFREVLVHFEKVAFVRYGVNRILDVVGLQRIFRDKFVEGFFAARRWIVRRAIWRIFEIVRGEKAQQFANHGATVRIIPRNKMGDAAFFVVCHRAAEFLLAHFFMCDGLDDIRAGD